MEQNKKVTEKTAAYADALLKKLASVSEGILKKKASDKNDKKLDTVPFSSILEEEEKDVEEPTQEDENVVDAGEDIEDKYLIPAREAAQNAKDVLEEDQVKLYFEDLCRIYEDMDADWKCTNLALADVEDMIKDTYKTCVKMFPTVKDAFDSALPEGVYVTASKKTTLAKIAARRSKLSRKAGTDSGFSVEEAHAPKDEKDMNEGKKEDKKDNPFGGSDKKEDKKEEKSEDKKDKPADDKSLDKSQKEALKDAFAAMEKCGDPACKSAIETLKSAFPFLGKEEKKEDKAGSEFGGALGDPGLGGDELGALPELGDDKAGDLGAGDAGLKPFAGLVATLKKQASVGDSIWVITDTKTNQEFASFNIKAAFGEHINKDAARAAYATSNQFGKDVIASLAANKAHDVMSATAAVLQVAAHYSPEWAGAKAYKDNPESSHAKASGEGDVTTDKNLIPTGGKEAKASAEAALNKKAEYNVPAATDNGEIAKDSALLDGADKRSEKVNTNTEKSATPANGTKVETETDRKLVASYEAQLKRQASENAALAKQIETLKTEAAIKEKSAKVKECVALMCNKGFIKADENVRVASLKEGLSIEAANGRAMAASIDKQAKYLFGMNSTQLDAYMNSLKGVSTPAFTTNASAGQALTIKASATSENETDRLLKLFGWD